MTRPVIDNFVCFHPSHTERIRRCREDSLLEGWIEHQDKPKRTKTSKPKDKKLDPGLLMALAQLDPATRALMEKTLKG